MDLSGPIIFDNIKIEADSDCAFFGIATGAISDVGHSTATAHNGQFAPDGSGSQPLCTLLSSASPYTISNSSYPDGSSPTTTKPSTNFVSIEDTSMMEGDDSIADTLFSADMAEAQLDFDLPEFNCDFDILEDDGFLDPSHGLVREDSDSGTQDSGTSSTPEACFGNSSVIDSPPLTPPSPVVKVESETNSPPPCHDFSDHSMSPGVLPLLKTLPNGANLTKILPALKSSRGRSASHDSPDIQALKRHIRMIRNRESASLSRKKKKEYVTTLEQRLKEVETENSHLRQENQLLKTRLLMQQQSLGGSSNGLANHSKAAGVSMNHGRNGLQTPKTKLIAKVALLGLGCFMLLSVHAPISRNHRFPTDVISNSTTESKVIQNYPALPDFPRHALPDFPQQNRMRLSRSFAWNDEFKETIHKGFDLDVEDKKLLKVNRTSFETSYYNRSSKNYDSEKVNRTRPLTNLRQHSRHLIQPLQKVSSKPHSFVNANITGAPSGSNCKAQFNRTESLRVQNDLKGLFNRGKSKKKSPLKPFFYSVVDVPSSVENNKGLTVYDQRMQKYSNFLDKIQLREDTFYVVSLAMDDQLLLSAKSSNASSRPKMSFLMPWRNDSLGGKEEVMQIDCEVTKVFNLNALRKTKR